MRVARDTYIFTIENPDRRCPCPELEVVARAHPRGLTLSFYVVIPCGDGPADRTEPLGCVSVPQPPAALRLMTEPCARALARENCPPVPASVLRRIRSLAERDILEGFACASPDLRALRPAQVASFASSALGLEIAPAAPSRPRQPCRAPAGPGLGMAASG